jgi:hypothetical protein
VASVVRRSCGAISSRSALPKENGQLTIGCVTTRPISLRTRPRARNTDSLVRSATETRDIEALAPLLAKLCPLRSAPAPEFDDSPAG